MKANRQSLNPRSGCDNRGRTLQGAYGIKQVTLAMALALALSVTAAAQEMRSEISVQGTRFFAKDGNGYGIQNQATNTGGFLLGYRHNINP